MEPSSNILNVLHPEKQKKAKAEGYSDKFGVYHEVSATELITCEDPLICLQTASCVSRFNFLCLIFSDIYIVETVPWF